MAETIKGITVKIAGDTTALTTALKDVNAQINKTQSALRQVDKALKLDPTNTELVSSKQALLETQIKNTEARLKTLNEAQKQAKEQLANGDIGQEKYAELCAEIAQTESRLKKLKEAAFEAAHAGMYELGKSMTDAGEKMESAGKKLMPLSATIAGIGALAVKTTADFDSSMSNVQAISGATAEEYDRLREAAKKAGETTVFSASQSADALTYMAMAGWKTDDMIDGLAGVMNLAASSGSDLAKTSDILTDGLTAFGLSASDSAYMADVMAAASSNANTNVELLGESYKYCASTAGSMGYSVDQITESLGLMANAGVKGSQGGTTLKNAMINLAKPTDAMAKLMDEYGISITNADGSMKSWNDVVQNLRDSLSGLTEDQQTAAAATLFGKDATAGMLALINSAPADVEKLSNAIANCNGTAESMADTMNDNLNGQITLLKSAIEGLTISIGEIMMPIIRKITSAIQSFVDKLNSMTTEQKKMIVVIGSVVAALAPLLAIGGKFTKGIGGMITKVLDFRKALEAGSLTMNMTVGIWVAAIAAAVAALLYLYNNCEEFRNAVNAGMELLKTAVTALWENVQPVITAAWEMINSFITFITETITAFIDWITPAIEALFAILEPIVTTFLEIIKTYIKTALDIIMQIFNLFSALFQSDFNAAWEAVKNIVSIALSAIQSIIQLGFDLVIKIIVGVAEGLYNAGTEIMNSLHDGIKKIWDKISDWFSELPKKIKDFFSIDLTSKGKGIFNTLWDGMKEVWSSITGWLDGVSQKINNMWESAKSAASNMWNTVNGSHAMGLQYVPFDGYIARLHQGERVLTAQENADYNAMQSSNNGARNSGDVIITQNIYAKTKSADEQQRAARRELVTLGLGIGG